VYGSDAVAGVINLISRRGQGPATARLAVEGGTYTTSRLTAELFGGTADAGYSLAVSQLEQADGPLDNSDLRALTFSGRFDFRLSERTSLKVVARALNADQEVPTNGPPEVSPLDANHTREDDLMFLGAELTHWATDWLEVSARMSRLEAERLNNDPADNAVQSDLNIHSLFDRSAVEGLVNIHAGAWGVFTVGAEYDVEENEESNNFSGGLGTDENRFNRAYFAQWNVSVGDFFFVPGVRWEDNERFGGDPNARVAAAYLFRGAGTKVRASWGTGITEPRLDQLFGFGGDPRLQPEQSVTWDAGIDQWLFDDALRFSATYFECRLRDVILFQGFGGPYFNGGDGITRGVETDLEVRFLEHAVFGASYMFLRTRATDVDEPLAAPTLEKHEEFIRRPTHSGRLYAGWHVPESYGLFVDVSVIGSCEDSTFTPFPGAREKNDGFIKTDFSAFWMILPRLRATVHVDNAFDVHYHEVIGFQGPHANFLAGLEYAFGL
jgi:vitamin B12 transporter